MNNIAYHHHLKLWCFMSRICSYLHLHFNIKFTESIFQFYHLTWTKYKACGLKYLSLFMNGVRLCMLYSLLMLVYSHSSEVHAWPWPWRVTAPPQFSVALCASSSRACPVLHILGRGRSQASDSCSCCWQTAAQRHFGAFPQLIWSLLIFLVFIFLFLMNVWLTYIPNIHFFFCWKYCFPLFFVFTVLKCHFYCTCFCFRIFLEIALFVLWQLTCLLKLFEHI